MIKINKKGFSLLEVMLALGVITIGLMGVSSLVLQNIQAQNINKNYLVASMLAQEGLELVRNVRDTNFLQNKLFSDRLLPDSPAANSTFTVDNDSSNVNILNVNNMNDAGCILYLHNGANKYYHHSSADSLATIYRRLIKVTDHDDYLVVSSNVEWSEHDRKHNYEAVTVLYDWW